MDLDEMDAMLEFDTELEQSTLKGLDWINILMAKKELPPLMRASEMTPLEFVSTGIPELDKIVQGYPLGRVTEIYGMEGVGKTSITLMSIAGMQKAGKKVLFCDVENALNPVRAQEFGVDLENLFVTTEVTIEAISDLVIGYAKDFDAVIVDSLAAMVPADEFEGEAGEAHMGLKARRMGQFMRKAVKVISESNTALIFINQQRESLEMFSAKYYTPGGKAVPFATSLRIELTSPKSKGKIEKTVKGVKTRVGQKVWAKVIKSKVSKPHTTAEFDIMY